MQAQATEEAKKALATRLITNELMLGTAGEWRTSASGKKYWWHEYQGKGSGGGGSVSPPSGSGSGVGDATTQAISGGSSKELSPAEYSKEEKIVEAVKAKEAASKPTLSKPYGPSSSFRRVLITPEEAEQQRVRERTAPRKVSEVMAKTNPNQAKLVRRISADRAYWQAGKQGV